MTIEWLHIPQGYPIEEPMEVNLYMVKHRSEFNIAAPGEYELTPKVKPRGYKSSRKMTVGNKGSATIGPNSNEKVLVHDIATHPAGEPGTNCNILLSQPGDIYILTGPNRNRTGALLHDIVMYTNRK